MSGTHARPWWSTSQTWWTLLPALMLGLALGLWMAQHLPWGAWARTDSVAYIQAAQHLAQGKGYRVYNGEGQLEWLAHFPPFYPMTLAVGIRAGLEWHQATRWNAALTFGLWGALLYVTFFSVTRRAPESLGFALFLGLTPVLVQYLTGAMSEGWFFVLVLLTLYGWWRAIQHGSARAAFWAGCAAGLAVLTRYAGLFLMVGLPLLFLAPGPVPARQRWRLLLAFLLPLWVMYAGWNLVMHWQGVSLQWRFPPPQVWWQQAVYLVERMPYIFWAEWLRMRPSLLPRWFFLTSAWAFFALSGPLGWWTWRAWQRWSFQEGPQPPLPRWHHWRGPLALWASLWAWSAWGYVAFVYLAHMLRNPPAAFYGRVLVPHFVLTSGALFMTLCLVAGWWEEHFFAQEPNISQAVRTQNRWIWAGLWVWALWLPFYFLGVRVTQDLLAVLQEYGHGYTRKALHDPTFWDQVRAWPQDIPFISTEAYATMLWAQRFAAWPPEAFDPLSAQGPLGTRQDDPWHRAFREGRAALLHLNLANDLWWEPRYAFRGPKTLQRLLRDLPVCWQGSLGTLYYQGPKQAELCPHASPTP